MVPSNNNSADELLASAHDSAAQDGLRQAVGLYLEAIDALVAQGRREEATTVLAGMLAATERRRGFFLGKREQSALGDQREAVANKYAQAARGALPSEGTLDVLGQIALEFPNDFDVRLANAEALLLAGYLLDALDEYKSCKAIHRVDVDLDVKLGEVYCQLGRAEDALGHVRRVVSEYAKAGNDNAVAELAGRLLEFAPNAYDSSFDALGSLKADLLANHVDELDQLAARFAGADVSDPSARASIISKLASCYEKLIVRDPSDQKLWQALTNADADAAQDLRQRMDGKAVTATSTATAAPASAAAPEPVSALVPMPLPVAAATPPPAVDSAPDAQPAATPAPAPPKVPSAAGGLSAFAKRKALELFANSEYEAAVGQLVRVVKMSPDVEALEMLLECYLVLDKHDDAARIGVQLADAEIAAGDRSGAIATLTTLSKKIADPALEQRRVDLLQNRY